jgi:hypothetical protein
MAPNTPGTRVPSHGTDLLGERYAYDFIGLDPGNSSLRFYRPSPLNYLVFGVRLKDCYGWGRPIYAASAGTVVQVEDGWPERNPVHLARDLLIMFKNAHSFNSNRVVDLRVLSGNFVIVETGDGYAVYAHAQTGSIAVSAGEQVATGQRLANVGHSGNSTCPHLHFQLMDNRDPWKAQGIPCCFRDFDVFEHGVWRRVENGIPRAADRIRKLV